MDCPKINKYYILPTNSWLKPLESLITDDIQTHGLIMLAENINKEKVIVKLTKEYNKNVIKINKMIKNLPNFVETYCAFECYEDFNSLDNNYEKKEGFCNGDKDNGIIITLEIMKKYKSGSLNKYKEQLDLKIVSSILSQLLLAQVNAYYKIGFLHNDIHLGNILLRNKKDTLNYVFYDKHIKMNVDIIPILSDFDRSKIFNKEYFDDKELFNIDYDKEHNIVQNLIKTFKICLLLLKNKDVKRIIEEKYDNHIEIINHKIIISRKNIRSIYKDYYDYERFINTSTSECFSLVNMLYGFFTGDTKELIPLLN
jgi:hypothetical protein